MNNLINGCGYDQADLMIISDFARKNDSETGQCLGGYYRAKIDGYLQPQKFSVNQTYRTCIIKHYIKGLGVGTAKQDRKILETCWEIHELDPLQYYMDILIDEINTIKPLVIIAMGEFPLAVLCGKAGVNKWRGSVLALHEDIAGRIDIPVKPKVLVTLHPNVVHAQEELAFLLRLDFKKAVDLLFNANKPIDYHSITIARNSGETIKWLDQFPRTKFPATTADVETHRGFITCIGFSLDGYQGLCVPLTGNRVYGNITETARQYYIVSQFIAERNLVNQHIGYDQRISQRFGLWFQHIIWDTMLAANTIAPEFLKNLGFLTSIYTDMSYYKDEGHDFNPQRESYDVLYSYNAKDAISTYQTYKKQEADLDELGMLDFFNNFVMRLYSRYYANDSIGFLIDLSKRDELNRKYEALINLKELELYSITNPVRLNLASPTQIGKFMEEMKFPVLRHRVDSGFMAINTDADSMNKMRIMDPIDYRRSLLPYDMCIRFLNLVLLVRRIDKVIQYINVGIHPWGRVHTSSRLAATTSGRSGGGKTSDQWPTWFVNKKGEDKIKWEKLGQSFQTVTKHGFIVTEEDAGNIEDGDTGEALIEGGVIGKDIREMYIPDKGWVIGEVDGAQAEARVCDVLGEDWNSLAEYEKYDKHCLMAAAIFTDFTYEDIKRMAKKEHTDEGIYMRQIGKHSVHAKNNGMEAFLFAQKYIPVANFKSALKMATEILKKIDKAKPNIENIFHKQVEECLRNTRCLIAPRPYNLPCGRKRPFLRKIDKHYLNVAYSYLPQCAISDHTKAAALRIMDQLDNLKVYMSGENHDSLFFLIQSGYIRKWASIAKRELERPIDFRQCSLPRDYELVIPAEFSIGRKSWGKMKEIKKFRLIDNKEKP